MYDTGTVQPIFPISLNYLFPPLFGRTPGPCINTSCPVVISSQPATQNLRNHPNVAIVLQDHKNNDIIHFIGAVGTNA